jgi:hypothetical protein
MAMARSGVVVRLGPVWKPTGVADRPGPEAELVLLAVERLALEGNDLLVTELPVHGGVIDALGVRLVGRLRSVDSLLPEAMPLQTLGDEALRLLATLRRQRRYRRETLRSHGFSVATLQLLTGVDALYEEGSLYSRTTLLPDRIRTVTSYEIKASDATRVVVQAARRRHLVDQSYVVFPSPTFVRWPPRTLNIMKTNGVGLIDSTTGRKVVRAKTGKPTMWARFQIARAISRALAG